VTDTTPPDKTPPPGKTPPPDATPPPEAGPTPADTAPTPPAAPRAPQPKQRRTGLLVLGIVLCVLGALSLLGGGTLVVAHATQRDADGFYSTEQHRLGTPTHALVTDLDVGTGGATWFFREGGIATLRITAESLTTPVFVGIARADDVRSYLSGAAYDQITDFDVDPFKVKRELQPGSADPPPPTQEDFWAVSASGDGQQRVDWDLKDGTWDAVIMNADGSQPVAIEVSVGAKASIILWIGVGLLVLGALLAVGGGFAVYYGAQER
jgi:hypothetical protein